MSSRRRARNSPKRSRKPSRAQTKADAVPAAIEPLVASAAECLACGEFVQAQQIAEEALRRVPGVLAATRIAGHALLAQSRPNEALTYLKAVGTAPAANGQDRRLFAEALRETGDTTQAMRVLRQLVADQPDNVDGLNELGLGALEFGQLETAERYLRQAFDLDASYPGVCLNFARSRRFEASDEKLIRKMRAVAARAQLRPEARADVLFALGKVSTDVGNYEEAFDHIAEANRLMHSILAFDAEQHERAIDRLIESFSPTLFARTSGMGRPTERPVFIVGMPRSGTTLVEQILAAHHQVHGEQVGCV